MPFSLPKALRFEASRDGVEPGGELPLSEASLSLFLDATQDFSRIEVLSESGGVLATLADTEFQIPAEDLSLALVKPNSPVIETVEIGEREARDIRAAHGR